MQAKHLLIFCAAILTGCAADPATKSYTLDRGDVVRPTVAVSPVDGAAYWSWIRQDEDGWNVYVSTIDRGTADPTTPIRVNHVAGNASPHDEAPAQVAVGPEGNVYVAWTNRIDVEGRRFPASNLLISVSADGGHSFSEETPINSDADGPPSGHTFHNVIVLDDGTVVVSWIDSRERDNAMRTAGRSASAATTDHEALHGVGVSDEESDIPGPQIWVARSVDQARTFVETAIIDNDSCPCCRTALAPGPNGTIYLSWRHVFENGDRDVVVARSDDAGLTFSEPVRVSKDGWNIDACPHAGPALAVDASDRVHVAWYTGAASGPGLYRAVSKNGGTSFDERIPVILNVPMAHADITPGVGTRIEMVYHVPSERLLLGATIEGAGFTNVSKERRGRASVASWGPVVARATLADGTIVGEVARF